MNPFFKSTNHPLREFLCLSSLLFTFLMGPLDIHADNSFHTDSLPPVFMIGEYERAYEELVGDCGVHLLDICSDSMDLAYKKWLSLLSDIEDYAQKNEFEIRGSKLWFNVFWNQDGSIKHIVYYPKPNSRNMNFDKFTQFLRIFLVKYKSDLVSEDCFSHYGTATFPSFAELYLDNN